MRLTTHTRLQIIVSVYCRCFANYKLDPFFFLLGGQSAKTSGRFSVALGRNKNYGPFLLDYDFTLLLYLVSDVSRPICCSESTGATTQERSTFSWNWEYLIHTDAKIWKLA
jgi:hypothetical protein